MDTTQTRARRRHPDSGVRISTGIMGELNHEWEESLGSAPAPNSWNTHPVLGAFDTPESLLAHNLTCTATESDRLLHALLEANSQGDQVAGRTVLQCMLGKVRRLSHTARSRTLSDPMNAALAACWDAICNYPLHRTSHVAGNLAMETLSRIPDHPPVDETPVEPWHFFEGTPDPNYPPASLEQTERPLPITHGSPSDPDPTQLVAETLAWALDTGALTKAAVQLLARLHLGQGRPPKLRDIANELDISHTAARRRHSRAVRQLAQAVSAELHA